MARGLEAALLDVLPEIQETFEEDSAWEFPSMHDLVVLDKVRNGQSYLDIWPGVRELKLGQ